MASAVLHSLISFFWVWERLQHNCILPRISILLDCDLRYKLFSKLCNIEQNPKRRAPIMNVFQITRMELQTVRRSRSTIR